MASNANNAAPVLADRAVNRAFKVTVSLIPALMLGALLAIIAVESTFKAITERAPDLGWTVHYDLGRVSQPVRRAIAAKIGLGALVAEEALYYSRYHDSNGDPLHGKARYRIHFAADKLPDNAAFWSLSLYDQEHFFVRNSIDRYSIGDPSTALHFNADGSLDIIIAQQASQPSNNWLPSPNDYFMVTLRVYLPAEHLRNGQWQAPEIEKITTAGAEHNAAYNKELQATGELAL